MRIARRGIEMTLTGEAAQWWEGHQVYADLVTNLPYTFHRQAGFFMYLTPCCLAAGTASDISKAIWCKACGNTVDPLCGTGPDREEV